MLSCDTPNGQAAPSPNAISAVTQALPASLNSLPIVNGGAKPNGPASTGANSTNHISTSMEQHVWLVTGPAGCGKTTIAKHIADSLKLPYIEGDEFHPPANIQKMSNGIPLTDADRWDWLTALREEAVQQLSNGSEGAVLTCSALKRKYRDVIRVAPYFAPNLHLHFIYLHASEEVLLQRVLARQGHYMGANMVHSQFDILEPPTEGETDVITIDVTKSIEEVKVDVLEKVLDTKRKTNP